MECPKCNKEFELSEADISTETLDKEIDIHIVCPHCNESAFYYFLTKDDLTPFGNPN